MKKEYDFTDGKRGAIAAPEGKTRITIYLDNQVLEAFRQRAGAVGRGYQTLINEALTQHVGSATQPVDAKTLRRILRKELRRARK